MTKPGRNDPCPCGSGQKYKRCCLAKAEGEAATPIGEVDGRVTAVVLEWVVRHHEQRMIEMRQLLPASLWELEDAAPLIATLVAWETPDEESAPVCQRFPERLLRAFDPRESDWFREQQRSWFSMWDVIEVRRDEGLFLRDLLTGEERFVKERKATHYVNERGVMLGRTARLGDTWVLAATHHATLPPRAAEQAIAEARRELGLGRGRVEPAQLRGSVAFRLAGIWDDVVNALLKAPPPKLQNTSGDELVLTSDMFVFRPDDRPEILTRLRAIPDLESADEDPEDADDLLHHVFARIQESHGNEPAIHLARIMVSDLNLAIETNSASRADETRDLLLSQLEGLIHFVDREEVDPRDMEDLEDWLEGDDEEESAPPEVPQEMTAEMSAAVLAYKEQHYATWPDTPLPALGGETPREAARDKRRKVFRELDLVLREIEQGESRLPFEQRFDVGIIRRELGMS